MDNEKVMCELITTLQVAMSGNQTIISELRKAVQDLHLEFKDYENICKSTDLTTNEIKTETIKINDRLDVMDKWQKVRLPIMIGMITLIIYAIGFFFSLNRVADMIQVHKNKTSPQAIIHPSK